MFYMWKNVSPIICRQVYTWIMQNVEIKNERQQRYFVYVRFSLDALPETSIKQLAICLSIYNKLDKRLDYEI